MSSRCAFVNVNIGIPACGVVRATNSAALVIPEAAARSTNSALARSGSDPVQPRSRDMASKSVEPTRALVSGRQSLGRERRWLQQKAREGPGGIRRTSARTVASHCSALSLRFQTAAAASRLSPHDVQGALAFRNDRAVPLGLRNHSAVPTQFAGEAGTGKEHRELPSPDARYSRSKSSGKETATDAAQRLLGQDRRQSGKISPR